MIGLISPQTRDAKILRRLGSVFYEAFLLTALLLILGFITLPILTMLSHVSGSAAVKNAAGFYTLPLLGRTLYAAIIFVSVGVYFVWSWTVGRRTLAMKTWGLNVVRDDGDELTQKDAICRYLAAFPGLLLALLLVRLFGSWASLALGINYGWSFIDPQRKFLQDRLASTRIVYSAPEPPKNNA